MDPARHRERMLDADLKPRGIHSAAVLEAMGSVPREEFVEENIRNCAYSDHPLSIGQGQTISQPYIVALMAQALQLRPTDVVLEVGTGSGYAAAVLARLCRRVFTVERHLELAQTASRRLARLGYRNVEVRHGDGTQGLAEAAPFDAISVAAGGLEVPPALRAQLRIGGRLVIPVGQPEDQHLLRLTRLGPEQFRQENLSRVRFVPLVSGLPEV
ncbi:MAG: protein-L-isoaspartate(D-aspartate) O-methyltransferase [Vulcanimicrobiota bacterium]